MRERDGSFTFKPSRRVLLWAGVASSAYYVGLNIFIPLSWPGYSSVSQTISELSAIGAPARPLWVALASVYTMLIIAFGLGVCDSIEERKGLRISGVLIGVYGAFGLYWPPMHQRSVIAAGGGTWTDTLHLVWAGGTVLLMIAAMSFGAAAFRGVMRAYTVVTIVVMTVFGSLTSLEAGQIEQGLPTPWIGVWERASITAYLAWVAVVSVVLISKDRARTPT